MIPYARTPVDDADIQAVVEALRSPWLTTGPRVGQFEDEFARKAGTKHAVAFSNGTAALHGAMHVYGVGPGDEVVVPANTFVASANCVVYQGATPVFADVEASTLLIDVADVEAKITSRTRGIIAVDFAGQPCDYDALIALAQRRDLFLHADACHALGATYHGRPVGSLAPSSSFSFHPVKPITTAEGGMLTTDDGRLASALRTFRSHGIASDFRSRDAAGTWEYDMESLGYNYRLSDVQCALGRSQLRHLEDWTSCRQAVAEIYRERLREFDWIEPCESLPDRTHAYHLFVTVLRGAAAGRQKEAFHFLRAAGVGAHVMYRPVYEHTFYKKRFPEMVANCPRAEKAYGDMLVLPIFSGLGDENMDCIIESLRSLQDTF